LVGSSNLEEIVVLLFENQKTFLGVSQGSGHFQSISIPPSILRRTTAMGTIKTKLFFSAAKMKTLF